MPNPTVQDLAEVWKRDFFSADREIKWTAAEKLHVKWLSSDTVLVGTIDAQGIRPDGKPFFVDFKTLNKRKAANMEQVKAEWRFDPQALSYGLLLGDSVRDFTVRWAIKSDPPTTQFEWYSYTADELYFWQFQVLEYASQIRTLRQRKSKPYTNDSEINPLLPIVWPTNLTNCTRYGWNYRCPLYDNGCPRLNFDYRPELPPRTHNVETEQQLLKEHMSHGGVADDLVILSSSSIEVWLGCHERYRRQYEDGVGFEETSDALQLGTEFHKLMKGYYDSLIGNVNK